MQKLDDRKAEDARAAYRAQLQRSAFPTIGTVHTVHSGPNRAQRRRAKFQKVRTPSGKPTNTQRPAFL